MHRTSDETGVKHGTGDVHTSWLHVSLTSIVTGSEEDT